MPSIFLRNQHLSDGGGGTTENSPDKVQPEKPEPTRELPDNIKNKVFSVDDFEPEQLPEHSQGEITSKKEEPVKKETNNDDKKTEVKKSAEEADDSKLDKKSEDDKKTDDKSKLPSFLKPPKDEKKTEEKKTEEKREVVKAIKPPDAGKVTRDYSGHSPDEIAAFKKMSDEAYVFTKKLIEHNRELKKLEGSLYLQHDNAYVLDPQYNNLQTEAHYARKEGDYWKEQLILIKQGKPWRPITSWDKDGNPVLGQELLPIPEHEESVRTAMNSCYNSLQNYTGQLQAYPSKYKAQVAQDLQAINAECKQRFSWETDPKLLDYSLEIEGLGDRTIREIKQDFSELFPPYMRSHPAVNVAGNLMVALRIGHAELAAARSQLGVQQQIAQDEHKVEPTSKDSPQKDLTKPVHGVTVFRDDDIT